MSKIFRAYNRSEDVVLIPDLPDPVPAPADEDTEDAGREAALSRAHAQELAEQLLADAQAEAQGAREQLLAAAGQERERLLAEAQAEAQQIREQARREGAEQGRQQKQEEIAAGLQDLAAAIAQLRRSHSAFLTETEQGLKLLAVDIAHKLVDRKIEEDDAILVGLVKKAVQSIRDADWITVEISANLPQLAQTLENELGRESVNGARLEVALRDLPDSGCWVQTPDGALDASLATQVANLKEIFSHMDEA